MPLPPLVEPITALSDHERRRTARHAALAGIGELGQRRLAAARVAVVGAGGLGSPVILALAAAGVGELVVIDDDVVEASNLQRQILHRQSDVGEAKVDSAVRAAADLAPESRVVAVRERLTANNAARLLSGAHVVVDGSDTFETRSAVASAAESLGVPLVWGTVQEFGAQVTVFWSRPPAGTSPVVLSDLHPPDGVGEPPSCAQVGVLGALCMQVGGLLAAETIKLVVGIGEPLLGRVLLVDALRATQREIPLRPADADAPAPTTDGVPTIAVRELDAHQERGAVVLDVREPDETAQGTIPGAVLIPLAQLLADPAAAGDGPFVVVCHAGGRARRAAAVLRTRGIDAGVLGGGMAAWSATVSPEVPA